MFSVNEIKNEFFQLKTDNPVKILPSKDGKKDYALKVFSTYGKREGFFNKLTGFVLQIFNAFKAMFGKSDWQMARKLMLRMLPIKLKDKAERKVVKNFADNFIKGIVEASHMKVENVRGFNQKILAILSEKFSLKTNKKVFAPFKLTDKEYEEFAKDFFAPLHGGIEEVSTNLGEKPIVPELVHLVNKLLYEKVDSNDN